MIVSVGTDALEIDRMALALKRQGKGFERRIFTEPENAYCQRKKNPASSYAARFAGQGSHPQGPGPGAFPGGGNERDRGGKGTAGQALDQAFRGGADDLRGTGGADNSPITDPFEGYRLCRGDLRGVTAPKGDDYRNVLEQNGSFRVMS